MEPTILVVEDNLLSAKLLEHQLKRDGYRVLIASNGFQGLKMAQANFPDLILLDLMLPGLDGFEVLNRLRADPQTADVPVVIVSAKSQPDDRQMAARIGANAYLPRPSSRAELLAVVGSLLSERRARAASRGTCVLLTSPHGDEATSVALYVGLALVSKGERATVVDFRPFSIAHSLLLNVSPRPDLASLSDPETANRLADLTVQHPSGLRLLNNLEGSGEAGQLSPTDVQAAIDVLLDKGGIVLADIPLYPADVLRQAVGVCAQILLVTRSDLASLRATHSALTMMQRAGVDAERIGIVAIGPLAPDERHVIGSDLLVLDTLPAEAGPDDPAFHALAERLLKLK